MQSAAKTHDLPDVLETHVVWPLLRPITSIVVLLNLREGLQGFQTFLVMTDGGPGDHTNVLGLEAYRLAFLKDRRPWAWRARSAGSCWPPR